jgi:nitrogen fixation protein FixH
LEISNKYRAVATKNRVLRVKLLDKNNKEIKDAILITNIKRLVQEGADFELDLKFDDGLQGYVSKVEFLMIGQWDIEIVVSKGGDVYQDVKRVVVR